MDPVSLEVAKLRGRKLPHHQTPGPTISRPEGLDAEGTWRREETRQHPRHEGHAPAETRRVVDHGSVPPVPRVEACLAGGNKCSVWLGKKEQSTLTAPVADVANSERAVGIESSGLVPW